MKKIAFVLMILLIKSQATKACEFNKLDAKISVSVRTLDYESHREVIKPVGSVVSGSFVRNSRGDFKVFSMSGQELPLNSLTFTTGEYDFNMYPYIRWQMNAEISGEALGQILTRAIGEKQISQNQQLSDFRSQVASEVSIKLNSTYERFRGERRNGVKEDRSHHKYKISDLKNPDNKLIVFFDFDKTYKCQ